MNRTPSGSSDALRARTLLLSRLREPTPLVTVELRPPRSGLEYADGIEYWIDMHHSIQRLSRNDSFVFLTDNAVGLEEEENLSHLAANLGEDVDFARLIPFLTCKHTLDYCMLYADRAASMGIQALNVVGGDHHAGPPRCVPHASDLRTLIRERMQEMALGGWANPHRSAETQVGYMARPEFEGDFFLTQVVTHHDLPAVEVFLDEMRRQGVALPGLFGVFFYRSANPKTLSRLQNFLPVPAEALTREFESGASAEEICARTIRGLRALGVKDVYISNLGFKRVEDRRAKILAHV